MPEEPIVTINSRKYDGTISRTWPCRLINASKDLLTFLGEFEFDVEHEKLGHIKRGTISYEYYWPDRWYNVFRFHEPGGAFRNYYCNINMPPTFERGVLDYVDLDIDVLVWKGFKYEVLDLDEFESNASKYSYPDDLKASALKGLDEVIELIGKREFPFDFEI